MILGIIVQAMVYMKHSIMELIGEDLINKNKIYISFSCRPQNEV